MPLTAAQKKRLQTSCNDLWEQYELERKAEFNKESGFKEGVLKRVGVLNSVGLFGPAALPVGSAINFGLTDAAPPNPIFVVSAIGMSVYQAIYMAQTYMQQGALDSKEQKIKDAVLVGPNKEATLQGGYDLTHKPKGRLGKIFPNRSTALELLSSVATVAVLAIGASLDWQKDQETGAVSGLEAMEAVGLFVVAALGAMALHASRLYNGISNEVRANAQSHKEQLNDKLLAAYQELLNKDQQGNDRIHSATFNRFVNDLDALTNARNISTQGVQKLEDAIRAMKAINEDENTKTAIRTAIQAVGNPNAVANSPQQARYNAEIGTAIQQATQNEANRIYGVVKREFNIKSNITSDRRLTDALKRRISPPGNQQHQK